MAWETRSTALTTTATSIFIRRCVSWPGLSSLMPASVQSDLVVSGQAELEAWVGWEGGSSSIDVQVDAAALDIRARDNSWRVPAQTLSFGGSFVEQRNLWSVFASQC